LTGFGKRELIGERTHLCGQPLPHGHTQAEQQKQTGIYSISRSIEYAKAKHGYTANEADKVIG
jgi:hypothetical protein